MKKKQKHQQSQEKPQGFLANFILFLGILFVISAVYFFCSGYINFNTQWDQTEWTPVTAQVVEVTQADGQPGTQQVTYEYQVDGTTYTGTTQRTGEETKTGDSVTIKYNPDQPSASTANLKLDLGFLIQTSIFAVLAILCLYGPSVWSKRKQRQPSRRLPIH